MKKVTVDGLHVILVDKNDATFEFDCSLKALANYFLAGSFCITGHKEIRYFLPSMVTEILFFNTPITSSKIEPRSQNALVLIHSTKTDWFKEMVCKLNLENFK